MPKVHQTFLVFTDRIEFGADPPVQFVGIERGVIAQAPVLQPTEDGFPGSSIGAYGGSNSRLSSTFAISAGSCPQKWQKSS